MNIQELLTYIEELSFKNSMFGYDKDDVDIQLDKICDEMEALVAAKDKEIASLRDGIVPPVEVEDVHGDTKEVETAKKEEEVVEEVEETKGSSNTEKELKILRKTAAKADADAKEAIAAKEVAEAKLRAAEAEIAKLKVQLEEALSADAAVDAPAEKDVAVDDAYNKYMRNAELLCQQLDELDTRRESIINTANAQSDAIITDARARAESIVGEAELNAKNINAEADARISSVEDEVRVLIEEGKRKADAEQARCTELIAKKQSLITYLYGVTGEIEELIEKVQSPQE